MQNINTYILEKLHINKDSGNNYDEIIEQMSKICACPLLTKEKYRDDIINELEVLNIKSFDDFNIYINSFSILRHSQKYDPEYLKELRDILIEDMSTCNDIVISCARKNNIINQKKPYIMFNSLKTIHQSNKKYEGFFFMDGTVNIFFIKK